MGLGEGSAEMGRGVYAIYVNSKSVHIPDGPKNEVTVHFAGYLENY